MQPQNDTSHLLPGFETWAMPTTSPLSPGLKARVKKKGLSDLIPFLETVPESRRKRTLFFFEGLSREGWRKLRLAGREAGRLVAAKACIGGDTLPPLLVPHGYPRCNDFTRALLVACVVCAWPERFARWRSVKDALAEWLIASGWKPQFKE